MLYRLCLDEFAVTIQCKELGQSLARGQLAEKKQYSCLKEHRCPFPPQPSTPTRSPAIGGESAFTLHGLCVILCYYSLDGSPLHGVALLDVCHTCAAVYQLLSLFYSTI